MCSFKMLYPVYGCSEFNNIVDPPTSLKYNNTTTTIYYVPTPFGSPKIIYYLVVYDII